MFSKLGKRAKPIQFYSDCYEELIYKNIKVKKRTKQFLHAQKGFT